MKVTNHTMGVELDDFQNAPLNRLFAKWATYKSGYSDHARATRINGVDYRKGQETALETARNVILLVEKATLWYERRNFLTHKLNRWSEPQDPVVKFSNHCVSIANRLPDYTMLNFGEWTWTATKKSDSWSAILKDVLALKDTKWESLWSDLPVWNPAANVRDAGHWTWERVVPETSETGSSTGNIAQPQPVAIAPPESTATHVNANLSDEEEGYTATH